MPKRDARSTWQGAWADALRAASIGWDLALPICGGALLGHWLERRFDTGYQVTLGMLMLGAMIGFYNAWRTLAREIERDRQRTECEQGKDNGTCQDSSGSSSEPQ